MSCELLSFSLCALCALCGSKKILFHELNHLKQDLRIVMVLQGFEILRFTQNDIIT
jgi:hypothetical protein